MRRRDDAYWVEEGREAEDVFKDIDGSVQERRRFPRRSGESVEEEMWTRRRKQCQDELGSPNILQSPYYKLFNFYIGHKLWNFQLKTVRHNETYRLMIDTIWIILYMKAIPKTHKILSSTYNCLIRVWQHFLCQPNLLTEALRINYSQWTKNDSIKCMTILRDVSNDCLSKLPIMNSSLSQANPHIVITLDLLWLQIVQKRCEQTNNSAPNDMSNGPHSTWLSVPMTNWA